ncbi:hypothetical protein WDJ50_11480 [Deinococcus sp. VB142]|uniref:DUF11 domain-containing protein n=1 Tax=Deinococcus sp. VB142 TaxID=3112952 RepID=A0AAU6Q056_9DEIO
MKRAITTLTAALLGAATAQEIATSLPLTSVGNKLMWTVGDQELKLVVGVSSRVQLDVYGAQFDPQDYRSPDYYGDENYSTEKPKAPVSSTFVLTNAEGEVVKEFAYGLGAQDWQTFINEDLPAGTYTLKVTTEGNGKNTFAFRLNSISAAVQADHLNVTVRSNDWVPALNVYNPGGAMSLRMYDGDGPKELEAELRDAEGNTYPIKVSGQLEWDDIQVPEAKGNYTVYLRQPKDTFQYSNTVGFELTGAPITVVNADTTGKLQLVAELVLPDETLPTQATVQVGEQAYEVQGSAGPFTLPAQEYALEAEPIKGAEVTIDQTAVTVEKEQTKTVKVQVKPQMDLSFSADKPEVCVGDVVKFTARATTEFERQPLPANVQVKLPKGFTADGETSVTARVDAANPGVLVFEAKAGPEAAGQASATATLLPWNKSQNLDLRVLPTATQIELRRAELSEVKPGETVTVTLTLKNTSTVAAPYQLTDNPGERLEALDPATFSGELQPGEEKTLSYRARVKGEEAGQGDLQATLSSACDSQQTVVGTLTVTPPPPPAKTVVAVQRESTVRIPFDSPKAATQIVIAHQPPKDATYVAGSSTLNGKALTDPQTGPSGKLYWTTPGAPRGVLTYKVTHEGALGALESPTLVGKYAKNNLEVLVGDGNLDDLNGLRPVSVQAEVQENPGELKLPAAGTIYRDRDRITVAVQGNMDDASLPTVNGVAVDAATLGKKVTDPGKGTQRREFFGQVLKPGENVIAYGGQQVKVYLAGVPVTAELTPEQLVADGVTPIKVGIKLLDAAGLPNGSTVTVQTSLEPERRDAQPTVGSYQITLKDGEGVLEMQPLNAPVRFDVKVLVGDKPVVRSFEAVPSKTRVGIGTVSAGALLGSGGAAAGEVRAAGYLETPIGDGKLYVAGAGAMTAERGTNGQFAFAQDKKAGLPNTANPLERYPTYGDASVHDIPLQGIDPVAFRYEHPRFNVQYRQSALPVDVFNLGINPTALSGYTRTNPQVSGFVAALPKGEVQAEFPADGTRVLSLGKANLLADSEVVEVVSVDARTGAEQIKRLQRLRDYTVDYSSGVVYFQKAVGLTDEEGNNQLVRVRYRLDDPMTQRQIAWGVQASTRLMQDRLTLGAAAVALDGTTSVGVRARYADGISRADLLTAYSGGGVMVTGTANVQAERVQANGSVRYQDPKYTGLNQVENGLAVSGDAVYKVTDRLGVGVSGYYRKDARTDDQVGKDGGYADVKATYDLKPFTVGLGVRAGFGDQKGFGLVGSAGYSKSGYVVKVEHAQPIGGELIPTTTVTATAPIRENVTLTARDEVRWGKDSRASVGLNSRFGMTNVAVNYDLPGADGWGNRARFGMDTTLPINDKVSLGLNGGYLLDLAGDDDGWNAGASLRYKDERLVATLGSDVSHKQDGFRVALKGGASYSVNDRLTLSTDATRVMGPKATDTGNNVAISAALRASEWQGLAYLRYKDGALAAQNPEVIGEANLEYHVPRYALRGGIAGRMLLNQANSATYQASASGTYYFTDRLGLGLAARALLQPATGYQGYSFGIEGSVRALPGTWVTLGYNPMGFTGINSNLYTRQGAYVRLDFMLDDGQQGGVAQQVAAQQVVTDTAPVRVAAPTSEAPEMEGQP